MGTGKIYNFDTKLRECSKRGKNKQKQNDLDLYLFCKKFSGYRTIGADACWFCFCFLGGLDLYGFHLGNNFNDEYYFHVFILKVISMLSSCM